MKRTIRCGAAAALLTALGCASQTAAGAGAAAMPSGSGGDGMDMDMHLSMLPATSGPGFTVADVRFMQGMIAHHAQAVTMSEWAPDHGAGSQLLKLAEKIRISQVDEIGFMERWLAERDQAVPEREHLRMMTMPGMLTPAQMAQLDAARGAAFDRLYLSFMIQHHGGAIDMVDALFDSPGAAQDSDIFRFVTDVGADQLDEIGVMQTMLEAMSGSDIR